ncbi:MAG: hypothetical protein A2857_06935 [Candidatus Levybacteria bacterium RIFCSPHIGHO2_01_FULL_36_15]|nr:MAG: hypothetical protein A2857_06935 [Candidatus Levybacteria bacterium RIFCSPHIGHO2_01_FULL_36_15]OGH38652.1 MAG: hypothetical protein A2905_04180 [Candidatus Levybacteria bacterium RIFCSPLOWO2_01_FULL_36_10]
MKKIFLFLISLVAGIIFIAIYAKLADQKSSQNIISPASDTSRFSLESAPGRSLRGKILSFSGSVDWQSRSATMPATLAKVIPIQQGEKIITKNGKIKIQFEHELTLNILPDTQVEFIQTLPENIVIAQSKGTADYSKTGTASVSVRTIHLLTEVNGNAVVSLDKNTPVVTVDVYKGLVKEAFNDLEYASTVITISEGKQFIFNDETRESTIKLSINK